MRFCKGLISLQSLIILLGYCSPGVNSKNLQKMLNNKAILSPLEKSRDDTDLELIGSFSSGDSMTSKRSQATGKELFGVPRSLLPLYASFILDAISVGLVMPLLPFFAMEQGANAFQLSLVVSSNYVAQMIGCVLMGLGEIYSNYVN